MATFDPDGPPAQEVADAQDGSRHLRRAPDAKLRMTDQADGKADKGFPVPAQISERDNLRLSDIARHMVRRAGASRSQRAGQVPGGAPAPTPGQRQAAADRRELAADARDWAADRRERAANLRDEQAQLRDEVAAEQEALVYALVAEALLRDQRAERRDRLAEARDHAAEHRRAGTHQDSIAAGRDRGQAAMDRARSGEDRDRGAGDRADLRELWKRAVIRARAADVPG